MPLTVITMMSLRIVRISRVFLALYSITVISIIVLRSTYKKKTCIIGEQSAKGGEGGGLTPSA